MQVSPNMDAQASIGASAPVKNILKVNAVGKGIRVFFLKKSSLNWKRNTVCIGSPI
jgi:hypothetical protein